MKRILTTAAVVAGGIFVACGGPSQVDPVLRAPVAEAPIDAGSSPPDGAGAERVTTRATRSDPEDEGAMPNKGVHDAASAPDAGACDFRWGPDSEMCVSPAAIMPAAPCPASYAAARGVCGMIASKGIAAKCSYPEGDCSCTIPRRCSGATPPPPRPTTELQWSCTPKHPPPRTDGCPNEAPRHGAQCTQPGKRCGYGWCGGSLATCHAGKWVVTMLPPPP